MLFSKTTHFKNQILLVYSYTNIRKIKLFQ